MRLVPWKLLYSWEYSLLKLYFMLSKSHIFIFLLSEQILYWFIFLNSFFHWLRNYTFNLYGLPFNLEHACLSEQSQNQIHNGTTFPNSSRILEMLTLIPTLKFNIIFLKIFFFNFLYMNLVLFIINFILYVTNMHFVYPIFANCFAHYWFWKPSSSFWVQFSSFWDKSFNNCFSKDTWVVKSLCPFCLKLFLLCFHSWWIVCLVYNSRLTVIFSQQFEDII